MTMTPPMLPGSILRMVLVMLTMLIMITKMTTMTMIVSTHDVPTSPQS